MSSASSNLRLYAALEQVLANTDRIGRRASDPISVVSRFRDTDNQELVALMAALMAFGNVKTVLAKLDDALARLGENPARLAEDPRAIKRTLRGWVHRVYRGEDLACLLIGARAVQRHYGSLGERFARDLSEQGALRPALAAFVTALRAASPFARNPKRRGSAHILPDPNGTSGCKRLLLFLRWMIRPADGVDLGVWAHCIPASVLVIPLDTHIHRLSRNLGLTERRDASWRTAEEVTGRLRALDPQDPVRYDFALCHMGMLRRCPSKRDVKRCDGCGVQRVCRHWQ